MQITLINPSKFEEEYWKYLFEEIDDCIYEKGVTEGILRINTNYDIIEFVEQDENGYYFVSDNYPNDLFDELVRAGIVKIEY